MSEADSKLLAEMFSVVKNIESRLSKLESTVSDGFKDVDRRFNNIDQRLDDQYEMIEQNFVELKETQTVVEIHQANKKIHAL